MRARGDRFKARDQPQQRALAATAAADDGDGLPCRNVQVDAAQHLVVAERFAQSPDRQRKPAQQDVRIAPQQPRLFDEIGAIHGLGIRGTKTKSFLHFNPQCFWKAGCQDSVSRSSARDALSASLPSSA